MCQRWSLNPHGCPQSHLGSRELGRPASRESAMTWTEFAIAVGLLLAFLGIFPVVFVVLADLRASRQQCPQCGHPFGKKRFSLGLPYYERLLGKGVMVCDGPRRYFGARVVGCQNCGREFVFGELGKLVEPFQERPRTMT